ncbi:MAG TPA: hypothetical protein VEZ11_11285 [Thermoanaerobaculia bacterium]|nr:hypothetical protein [Thermoanaerobaculia bacterium]
MRRSLLLAALAVLVLAFPLCAQNTDIESLSGLQFNFGNPGARSLGMGGAFLGLADDASAAEANPAGLTILRKPEVSFEARNYLEQQLFSTSGTFPEIDRTGFNHYSMRVDPTFASFVYPIKNFAIAAYYHQPLRNEGVGSVVPIRNQFTGEIKTDVPNFFLPKNGTPVSSAECDQIRKNANDFFACIEYAIIPFLSTLDVEERTWGVAGAWKLGPVSLGAAARFQQFKESALTLRVSSTLDTTSISTQATGSLDSKGNINIKQEHAITYVGGFKWTVNDKLSFGGSYKKGAQFPAPTFAATSTTNFQYVKVADTKFHTPDVAGLGVSVRPIQALTLNVDAVHVKYSNLVDNFFSINDTVRALSKPYKANDVTELHGGGEYFFATKIPFAIRAGFWRDPAHSIQYAGPLDTPDRVAAAILYPKGHSQNHKSVGVGLAWPRFQVDAAYETSPTFKVGSISVVARY